MPKPAPQYPICSFTRTNGRRCQSPAAGVSVYCFFHMRTQRRRPLPSPHLDPRTLRPETVDYLRAYCANALASLSGVAPTERGALQITLAAVVNGLSSGQIPTRDAGRLLNSLQTVSRLLR